MAIWPESFVDKGPSHLLQSFFDSLPDHQVDIKRGSTALTQIEVEVNSAAAALWAHMTAVCDDSTLMLNLKPSVHGVTTIDLTLDEAVIKFPRERGNITLAWRDNKDAINVIPYNTSSIQDYSFMSVAPSLAGSTAPVAVASPSGQPHSSLKIDKWPFSPKSIRRVKNFVTKENTAATLALIGVDQAAFHIEVTAAQEFEVKTEKDSSDEESDGVPSDQDIEDDEKVSLLSDEEDGETASAEVTVNKTVKDEAPQALESDESTEDNLDEASGDEDFIPGSKKKECRKHDIQPNTGTRDGPVCLNPAVLAVGQKEKSQADHVSVQVVQWSMRVYLFK